MVTTTQLMNMFLNTDYAITYIFILVLPLATIALPFYQEKATH